MPIGERGGILACIERALCMPLRREKKISSGVASKWDLLMSTKELHRKKPHYKV